MRYLNGSTAEVRIDQLPTVYQLAESGFGFSLGRAFGFHGIADVLGLQFLFSLALFYQGIYFVLQFFNVHTRPLLVIFFSVSSAVKNGYQQMRSTHSPKRSCFFASLA